MALDVKVVANWAFVTGVNVPLVAGDAPSSIQLSPLQSKTIF
jgi:hypothetical protein